MKGPRILLWDLETSHNIVATFDLRDKYNKGIPHENILRERQILCAAWMWYGENKVFSACVQPDDEDDAAVVRVLHTLIGTADVIVAHNGNQFDLPFLEGRVLHHKLPPLPPILKLDTLKLARKRFRLNSNRLDYLGQYLGVGRKTHTPPGLWLRALDGDELALKQMVAYNRQDVKLLEAVFRQLAPYFPDFVNRQLWGFAEGCPRCGSLELPAKTIHRTPVQAYERYQCRECGGWYRERKALREPRTHKRIL